MHSKTLEDQKKKKINPMPKKITKTEKESLFRQKNCREAFWRCICSIMHVNQ